MRVILADTNFEVVDAWCSYFQPFSDVVEIYCGSIFDVTAHAYVSPANSFGFMDGGIDFAYMRRFPGIQDVVQNMIVDRYEGELPVGVAEMVDTNDSKVPHLIVAPTMRVPMVLPMSSVNTYLATRAVLVISKWIAELKDDFTVAIPGMGTGVGSVPPRLAAFQMHEAWKSVSAGSLPSSWQQAKQGHNDLLRGTYFADS